MILNIRGTSGSGKTTLMRQLMDHFAIHGHVMELVNGKEKIIGYRNPAGSIRVVGKYETVCGGCDTIKTQDEIVRRVTMFAAYGDVLFEGLLISHIYGRYRDLATIYKPNFKFAFLDTPLEVCLERVTARRAARGVTEPLNPYQTVEKWKASRSVYAKAEADGLDPVWLPWENPLPAALELLGDR